MSGESGAVRSVLIVHPNIEKGFRLKSWLTAVSSVEVVCASSGRAGLRALLSLDSWTLVVGHLELADPSGLDLLRTAFGTNQNAKTVLISPHAKLCSSLQALEPRVSLYVHEVFDRHDFLVEMDTLIGLRPHSGRLGCESVLVVATHPDEAISGCGGLLARYVQAGVRVVVLVTGGAPEQVGAAPKLSESLAAAEALGVEIVLADCAGTGMYSRTGLIGAVRDAVEELRPSTVLTHSPKDACSDHRRTFQAAQLGARGVANLLCYQGHGASLDFRPSTFVDVSHTLRRKLEALRNYLPSPDRPARIDSELVAATARYWGRYSNTNLVEPLEVVRGKIAF